MRFSSEEFGAGIRSGGMLCPAVVCFGATFGLLAHPAGLDMLGALLMSATTFAGSAQFAATSVLIDHGGAAAAVIAAALMNLRYLPIGISVASVMRGSRSRRLVEAQLITDESWAISRNPNGEYSRGLLLGSGAVLWLAWTLGTAVGYVGYGFLTDPNRFGLDMAFPALFVALLPDQLRGANNLLTALLAALITLALLPFTSTGVAVLGALLACLVVLRKPPAQRSVPPSSADPEEETP